jgi:hypothetical protein
VCLNDLTGLNAIDAWPAHPPGKRAMVSGTIRRSWECPLQQPLPLGSGHHHLRRRQPAPGHAPPPEHEVASSHPATSAISIRSPPRCARSAPLREVTYRRGNKGTTGNQGKGTTGAEGDPRPPPSSVLRVDVGSRDLHALGPVEALDPALDSDPSGTNPIACPQVASPHCFPHEPACDPRSGISTMMTEWVWPMRWARSSGFTCLKRSHPGAWRIPRGRFRRA